MLNSKQISRIKSITRWIHKNFEKISQLQKAMDLGVELKASEHKRIDKLEEMEQELMELEDLASEEQSEDLMNWASENDFFIFDMA